jgi:hypothetical protein
MIPDEGIVASEIEAGLSYATISGAEILPNIAIKRSDRRSFGWSGELGSERNRLIAVICLPSKLRGLRVGSALREQVQV